ncbi:methyltransferase domain containing protein [Theileria equi strain WA]|uniref:Methyltransferase domain containing protein n=1 Tax=Theileria equi strain WA TaxID=1537102 RepID=L1LC29_THEEQ|nr:methyltransferase domain containing protein [Theileria equi strain WA]EKX72829.1 methyltransferase domain containing protein [Theileria equi strain WA]|eukprot:XP_004832281.1 methyltransferase domain containing protein [Theileria equi strain WA]
MTSGSKLANILTFSNVINGLVIVNGALLYTIYTNYKAKRPEYKLVEPPTETHRINIYNSIASTYDSTFEPIFEKNKVNKTKKVIVANATGHVLEVAAGTLGNLKYYGDIDSLTAIDKSVRMCVEMKKKVEKEKPKFPVTIICGDASKVPFNDSGFNTIVSTYALCSVEDPVACVKEIARVMKPGGSYFALERGKIHYWPIRKLMSALRLYPNPSVPWKNGYYEDRDPLQIIQDGGLKVAKFVVFGFGVNYSIFSKRDNVKVVHFADGPEIDQDTKVFYRYTPQ